MKSKTALLLFVSAALIIAGQASATIYVSETGSNTSGDSWATALNSLSAAGCFKTRVGHRAPADIAVTITQARLHP